MSTYDPLRDRLSFLRVPSVRMKFSDIEEIIGRELPQSARRYPAWWANNDQGGKRHSVAWLHAGWRTENLALEMEEVTFAKGTAPPASNTFSARIDTNLSAEWVVAGEVALSPDGHLAFPNVPADAGVYRFRFVGCEQHRCYIGESANLKGRFGFYRRPGSTQQTNLRLNGLMREHLSKGGMIEVDLITFIGELRNESTGNQASLSDKAVRRLFEQAAIVADDATEIESLNR